MNTSARSGWMLIAALAWGCSGGATAEEPEEPSQAAANEPTSGDELARADGGDEPMYPIATSEFLGMVTVEAAPGVCGDSSPFRQCYPSLDASQCATVFGRAMLACGEAMSGTLPQTIEDDATAEAVAEATARCAGQAFTQGLDQAGVPRAAECQQAAE